MSHQDLYSPPGWLISGDQGISDFEVVEARFQAGSVLFGAWSLVFEQVQFSRVRDSVVWRSSSEETRM